MVRGGSRSCSSGHTNKTENPLRVARRLPVLRTRPTGLIYADSREPTSGLEPLTCSLRVISQALQGLARGCKTRISKPFSLLRFAPFCTVLRCRWYQSGIRIEVLRRRSLLNWLHDYPSITPFSKRSASRPCSALRRSCWRKPERPSTTTTSPTGRSTSVRGGRRLRAGLARRRPHQREPGRSCTRGEPP